MHYVRSDNKPEETSQRTKSLEPLSKPAQPHHNDDEVDKTQIRHNGCHVKEDLLIQFQVLDINTES